MKLSFICTLIFLAQAAFADSGVQGKVASPEGCGKSVMVWLSLDKDDYKERLLLMHTEVPVGGSFKFFLRPGAYQVRASDEKGCDYLERVVVKEQVLDVAVKLVKR